MDFDRKFVSMLVTSDIEVFKYAIKNIPVNLLTGVEAKIYDWVIDYYRLTKGSLPTPEALISEFKGYKLLRTKERVEFFEKKLKERRDYKILTKGVTDVGKLLFEEDIEKAVSKYRQVAIKLSEENISDITTIKDTLPDRKKSYITARTRGGKIGYYFGIPTLDKHLGGLGKEFMVIMGNTSIGKTFLSLMIMVNIWKESKKPLLIISNEMDRDSIYGRIDSVVGKFNNSRYRRGQLSKKEEIILRNLSKIYDKLPDLYVVQGAGKNVDEVEYDVIAVEPAAVLCDGIYLTDMGKNDTTQDTIAASRAYQRLGKKYEIPVIATSQMIEGQTKYARALQEDADIVLKMFLHSALRDMNMMGLTFKKIRQEDANFSTYLNWDFEKWNFDEADVAKTKQLDDKFA